MKMRSIRSYIKYMVWAQHSTMFELARGLGAFASEAYQSILVHVAAELHWQVKFPHRA